MGIPDVENIGQTIAFDDFWRWLMMHNNCILRAGTPDVLMFDHEDFHWHFFTEGDSAHIVQLVRGKALVSELVVLPSEIAYVQVVDNEHEETLFECVVELPEGRDIAYHFVLAHTYDGADERADDGPARRWTH